MNIFSVAGKFLDQPMLVSKFQKAVPTLLTVGAAAYTIYDASKEKDKEKFLNILNKILICVGIPLAIYCIVSTAIVFDLYILVK